MANTVRINTRISERLNDWLDDESEKTGIPKSTLIHLALEQYVHQKDSIGTMGRMLAKLEELEKKL